MPCPHCTHCEALTEFKEKEARWKRELEEEDDALLATLSNEAKRHRLEFAREQKKLEEKLEADIETNERRSLARYREK